MYTWFTGVVDSLFSKSVRVLSTFHAPKLSLCFTLPSVLQESCMTFTFVYSDQVAVARLCICQVGIITAVQRLALSVLDLHWPVLQLRQSVVSFRLHTSNLGASNRTFRPRVLVESLPVQSML